MPVTRGVSIWDYLALAGGEAIDSYQAAKEKTRTDALANAGLLNQLFNSGAVGSETLQPAVEKVPGMAKVKIQPNVPEKQRTPGTPENLAYQAQGQQAQIDLTKTNITTKWIEGKELITEKEAQLAGLPTLEDMALMRQAKRTPMLEQAAEQYIDQYILSVGGRLSPSQAMEVSGIAYQNYVRDYQAAGLGTLSASDLQNAARFFTSHALKRMNEQRALDIQLKAAENRGYGQQDRMFAQMTLLGESARRGLDDFVSANPGVENIVALYKGRENEPPPPAGKGPTPMLKGLIERHRVLANRIERIQMAQAQLNMGILPTEFSDLLSPAGNAGGAGGSGAKPGTEPGADGSMVDIAGLTASVKAGKVTAAQINSSPLLTPDQKARIIGKPAAPATKPAPKKNTSSIEGTNAPSGTMMKGPTQAQKDSVVQQTATRDSTQRADQKTWSRKEAKIRYDRMLLSYGPDSPMTIEAKKTMDALNE